MDQHSLQTVHHVPVSCPHHPERPWLASVGYTGTNDTWEGLPTEQEARMIASYIAFVAFDFYKLRGLRGQLVEGFRDLQSSEVLDARDLPTCQLLSPGANTVVLLKREPGRGWGYRRATWTMGPWSWACGDLPPQSLLQTLDVIEHNMPERWCAWKLAHRGLFEIHP